MNLRKTMPKFAIGIACVVAISAFVGLANQPRTRDSHVVVVEPDAPPSLTPKAVASQIERVRDVAYASVASRSAESNQTEHHQRARQIFDCIKFQNSRRHAEELLAISTSTLAPAQFAFHEAALNKASRDLDSSNVRGGCEDIAEYEAANQLYPELLRAAEAGDWDAASCYVIAPFDAPDQLMTEDGISAYRDAARTFIIEGMHRGDWRFVSLAELSVGDLVARHRGQFKHNLFHRLVTPDQKMGYGYVRLERLGATGGYANQLDARLVAMSAHLSEADLEEMNRWAAEEYRISFLDQPKVEESPALCDLR